MTVLSAATVSTVIEMEALRSPVDNTAFPGQEGRLKDYLEAATEDSVLHDLKAVLEEKIGRLDHLRDSFQRYGLTEPSKPTYWTAESFWTFVKARHVNVSYPQAQVLWRCLYFYAYHPFPRYATTSDTWLDLDGFLRAAALLAIRGTELLGIQNDGSHCWRREESFFRNADLKRVFRSISRPAAATAADSNPDATSMIEDAMDVLAMVIPRPTQTGSLEDEVEATARRLLDTHCDSSGRISTTSHDDLTALLSLILRMKLEKISWGPGYHFGSIEATKAHDKCLTDSLLYNLPIKPAHNVINDQALSGLMEQLPNMRIRFYQLWSVIFQPDLLDHARLSEGPKFGDARILRAISLFLPRHIENNISGTSTNDRRHLFEPSHLQSPAGGLPSLAWLKKHLTEESRARLVLVSDGSTPSHRVMGAYFPRGLPTAKPFEVPPFESKDCHVLFCLLPELHILEWPHKLMPTSLDNLLYQTGAAEETKDAVMAPYVIGLQFMGGAEMKIEPELKSVGLYYLLYLGNLYREVGAAKPADVIEASWGYESWNARLDIFHEAISATSVVHDENGAERTITEEETRKGILGPELTE